MIDLDAYFARIGYFGSRSPSLSTLHGLAHAHVGAIPFENCDVLLGRGIDLDLDKLQQKLIFDRRGGYCFEQNTLMLAVLEQLGFRVKPLSARVRYQRPRDFTPARTHLLVRVELDADHVNAAGSWLVDVGVGAMSPTAALRLDEHGEQSTPHEPRRLLRENGLVYHQAKLGGEWVDVAELTLEEMPVIDRIVANWYTSAHPASHFRNRLLVARAGPNGRRYTVLNREFTVRERDGSAEKMAIQTPDQLLDVLGEHFGLSFPAGTRFACEGLDW